MSRKVLTLVSMIVVLAMLLSACGGSKPTAAPTQASAGAQAQPPQAPAAEKATLKVLVHQNPPDGRVHEYLQ